MEKEVPEGLKSLTSDAEEISRRNEDALWKIKGLVAEVTCYLFDRFGDPAKFVDEKGLPKRELQGSVWSHVEYSELEEFAQDFKRSYGKPLLAAHLEIFTSNSLQNFVGTKCLNYSIKFISTALQAKYTTRKVQPHIEGILKKNILAILKLTDSEIQTFNSNAAEYIREYTDNSSDAISPKK